MKARGWLVCCAIVAILTAVCDLQAATFFVSATKTSFIWGEPVKVTAVLYDDTGNAIPTGSIAWSVTPSSAAAVAADGTVTPLGLTTFTVKGVAGSNSGQVQMQVLPSQIIVKSQHSTMLVGTTQQMAADALDVNSKPIPNTPVSWRVTSEYFDSTNSATINSTGTLTAVMQARVRVEARISYNQSVPTFDLTAQGDTLVDIKAPTSYKFERVFVAKPSGAPTSTLAPRAAPLIPTPAGGFMFAASLDGVGGALVEWNNGGLAPLLSSGRVNLVNGYPLGTFAGYTRTSSGEILVQETDLSGGVVVSRGQPGVIAPILANGSAVFGAQYAGSFLVSRNSLADSGAMSVSVAYTDAITHLNTVGLFRGFGGGISEPVINNRDTRIANAGVPGWFDTWGVANDGTAWFESGPNKSVWRSRLGQAPELMLVAGQALGNSTIDGYLANYSPVSELFFVAGNGDVVNAVFSDKGQQYLLWHDGDTAPSATLAANAYGLYWYDPSLGALIDASFPGKSRGLYLWNSTGTKPLLLLNDLSIDGSPVQEITSATSTSDGTIYVMVRTTNNPMLIARLSPNPQVLLKAGDAVPITVPPVITSLIPGARSGIPMVLAGGSSGSIAQLDSDGNITRIVPVGTKLPDGKYYAGSKSSMVRSFPDGRIIFAHDYFASDSSLYTWNQGSIELTVRAPLKKPDGTNIGAPSNIEINRQGDVGFQFSWNGNTTYRLRGGTVTTALETNPTVEGVTIQSPAVRGIDDSGRILFTGSQPDGSGFYVGVWDGSTSHIIMDPKLKMPDGRVVSSNLGAVKACANAFVVGTLGTVARYQNGTWDYLMDPAQKLATGEQANSIDNSHYDVNHTCDATFTSNTSGVTNLGARVNGQYDEIFDLQQLTPDGDLLTVAQMLINDDGTVYALGANDQGQEVIYRATPLAASLPAPPSNLSFQISNRGGISNTTSGGSSSVKVGFAEIVSNSGSTSPSGMAIFDFRQNGILISEAAVPASPLVLSGRTYAEIGGAVDTGIAIANPNNQAVTISFYFTDATGTNILSGATVVAANSQISAFLDQAPFIGQGTTPNLTNVRTFTFASSLPVGVTALRGYINERSEFLITTLPLSPINTSSTAGFAFPHFADGGGWTSAVVLINPTDSTISGTAQFYSKGTTTTAGAAVALTANGTTATSFSYTIPPRGAFKLQTAGAAANVQTGWVKVTPNSGNIAPSGLVVFAFQSNGVRVSEAGVPALSSSSAFRMYAEASGSIQTGIAISNPGSANVTVSLDLTNLDGTATGLSGTTTIPATGQVALFLNQISGFEALPPSFKGVLRISGANVFVSGLRGRYNERGDFLITTTAPVDESLPPSTSEVVFPQLADGGGYTTQVILFSGAAGQSSSGVLQFVSQAGQPLTLILQ